MRAIVTGETPRARGAWIALAILVVAFGMRALFLFSSLDRDWPHSVLYEGDAPVWVHWAQALDRGEPFEFDLPLRTPAVAFALHWLVPGVLKGPFVSLKLVWCVLSAASCALAFFLARRDHGAIAAWVTAGLACFSFGSYVTATSLNNETPYTLVLLALVLGTLCLCRRPAPVLAVSVGLLHGLALLLRAEHVLLFAVLLPFPLLARRSFDAARGAVLVAATAILVCVPWIVHGFRAVDRFDVVAAQEPDWDHASPPWTPEARAYLESLPAFARQGNFAFLQHLAQESAWSRVDRGDVERFFLQDFAYVPEPLSRWNLTSALGPLDFALANHPDSRGGFSLAALDSGHDPGANFSFARPSDLRLFNHGYSVGFDRIRADFPGWVALVGKKLSRFADGATLGLGASDWPFGRHSVRHPVDVATPEAGGWPWRCALAAAIVLGAGIAWRRSSGAILLVVVAYKLAVTTLFFGYARQAVSIAPVLYVLAGIGIARLVSSFGERTRVLAAAGAVATLLLFATDVGSAVTAHPLVARAVRADASMSPAPEWGAGAFEMVPDIEIVPR